MSANPIQSKSHWVLAALLLSQLILMTVTAKDPDNEQSVLRTWTMTVLAPVLRVGDSALSTVSGAFSGWGELRRASTENVALREQVEQLTAEVNESREKAAQLESLRSSFGLPSSIGYTRVTASVIARDSSLWFKRLTIDRGTLDGVKRNMPVVTALGVVGRVITVGPNFAQVQVITDSNAGAGVMLQSTRAPGILKGMNNALCEVKNITSTEEVKEGETVVTTGLDRIYPKGLVVGIIERVENDANGPWKKIIVNPAAKVDRVENVYVLIIEPKDLKVEENLKP